MRNFLQGVCLLVACFFGYLFLSVGHASMPTAPTWGTIELKDNATAAERFIANTVIAAADWEVEDHYFFKTARSRSLKVSVITYIGADRWYVVSK